ncbi:MAG: hypothetical protein IJ736_12390, partial [Firmicutes bacterium]|nr:hypothetical protein [Bacillota bacterium]
MAKYILIRLINCTEYYVNQKQQITAVVDGLTGKKTRYEPSNDWIVKGMWFKKLFGGRDIIDILQCITDVELGNVKYQDKKGNLRYGISEVHTGAEINREPLQDVG